MNSVYNLLHAVIHVNAVSNLTNAAMAWQTVQCSSCGTLRHFEKMIIKHLICPQMDDCPNVAL